MQESITERGVRSSWEAEATNRACCLWLSSSGSRSRLVKNQENSSRAAAPARSRLRNRSGALPIYATSEVSGARISAWSSPCPRDREAPQT